MVLGHHKEIQKPTFRELTLRQSESLCGNRASYDLHQLSMLIFLCKKDRNNSFHSVSHAMTTVLFSNRDSVYTDFKSLTNQFGSILSREISWKQK